MDLIWPQVCVAELEGWALLSVLRTACDMFSEAMDAGAADKAGCAALVGVVVLVRVLFLVLVLVFVFCLRCSVCNSVCTGGGACVLAGAVYVLDARICLCACLLVRVRSSVGLLAYLQVFHCTLLIAQSPQHPGLSLYRIPLLSLPLPTSLFSLFLSFSLFPSALSLILSLSLSLSNPPLSDHHSSRQRYLSWLLNLITFTPMCGMRT